jgi:hypothetical protein
VLFSIVVLMELICCWTRSTFAPDIAQLISVKAGGKDSRSLAAIKFPPKILESSMLTPIS